MKTLYIKIVLFLSLAAGCTVEFLPETGRNEEKLVVEGMITDQNRVNTIKLSKSTQIGLPIKHKVVTGALVTITDNNGTLTMLEETSEGIYSTDSLTFTGQTGNSYALRVEINGVYYETDFIEMKPVPPINSLYYEKVVITSSKDSSDIDEGCKIYVDSYDPTGECQFFRWDYTETWEYKIPYMTANRVCWVTEESDEVLIKNTSQYSQARITEFPVLFISNKTDRLKETYSILVNQYSLNESEFDFWSQVQNISQNVGSPYDIIPYAVRGNIRCITYPDELVLGYFSVSAVTQKRLFIHDRFMGLPNFYTYCATDTIGELPETGLNTEIWVIEDYGDEIPPFWVISAYRECADCTFRGSRVRPSFWLYY